MNKLLQKYLRTITLVFLTPIPCIPTLIPRIPTLIHRIPTLIPCIPTMTPRIPTLIPYIPRIPTPIPRLPTLIPCIPIAPLIPSPDSPFWLLQIWMNEWMKFLFKGEIHGHFNMII